MFKIQEVDYLFSELSRKQAKHKNVLEEWNTFHSNIANYDNYKQQYLKLGNVYSEKAIQWLFANGYKIEDFWIETDLNFKKFTGDSLVNLKKSNLNNPKLKKLFNEVEGSLYHLILAIFTEGKDPDKNNFEERLKYDLFNTISIILADFIITNLKKGKFNEILTGGINNTYLDILTKKIINNYLIVKIDDHYLIRLY